MKGITVCEDNTDLSILSKKRTSMKLKYKPIILSFWAIIAVISLTLIFRSSVPLNDYPQLIAGTINEYGTLAPFLFILLFAIRPLIFFPATLLSLSTGFLFGPWKAIAILIVAENLSSLVSYFAGKYAGKEFFAKVEKRNALVHSFEKYFHHNEFITILILRLIFVPFDLLGYFAGASNIRYKSFALATLIGILPGLATAAFVGGSATHPYYLILAGAFFILGIFISKFIKKRYSKGTYETTNQII